MKEELHCWDLNLGVTEINQDLSREIRRRLLNKFKSINRASKYYSKLLNKSRSHVGNLLYWMCKGKSIKYEYGNKTQECAIPINDMIKITETLKINKEKMEEGLISIRNFKSPIKIYTPKFPVRINPVTSSLLFHYYCDGSKSNWSQSIEKHPINRKRYFQKIEESLGKLYNWNSKKHQEIHTPVIIYQILEKLFNIKRDHLTEMKFPKGFLKLDKEVLVGALIAIIADEGHVCYKGHYEIRISQKSKEAINIFHEICQRLQYDVSPIKKEVNREIYTFKIRWKGLFKFYKDLTNLNKKYSVLDLGDKQQIFEERIKMMKNKIKKENSKRPKGYSTKLNEKDLSILKYFKNQTTKRKLSELTGYSLSVLHHVKGKLKILGLIKVEGWKGGEPLLKITKKGEKILKTWKKDKEQQRVKFKETVFKSYMELNQRYKKEPTIKELCKSIKELNTYNFYKIWENKNNFEEELANPQSL